VLSGGKKIINEERILIKKKSTFTIAPRNAAKHCLSLNTIRVSWPNHTSPRFDQRFPTGNPKVPWAAAIKRYRKGYGKRINNDFDSNERTRVTDSSRSGRCRTIIFFGPRYLTPGVIDHIRLEKKKEKKKELGNVGRFRLRALRNIRPDASFAGGQQVHDVDTVFERRTRSYDFGVHPRTCN
jgi:hypothetical protein